MVTLGTGILLFVTHLLACISVGFVFRFWKRNEKKRTLTGQAQDLPLRSNGRYTYANNQNDYSKTPKQTVCLSNLGEVIATSIMNSINTIVLIGGFVVLFSVIISILQNSGLLDYCARLFQPFFSVFNVPAQFCAPFLSGIIELTNGAKEIASIPFKAVSTNVVLCSFILRFWWNICIITNFKCNF